MEGIFVCVGVEGVRKCFIEIEHTHRNVQTFSQTDHTYVNSTLLKKQSIIKTPEIPPWAHLRNDPIPRERTTLTSAP